MGCKERDKEGMGNGKNIRNVTESFGLGLEGNSLMPFLNKAVMKMKIKLFSTLVTVSN